MMRGMLTYRGEQVFLIVKNGGRLPIRAGDLVLWKPHVARSRFIVKRATKPHARANSRFCGLAVDTIRPQAEGSTLVFGPAKLYV